MKQSFNRGQTTVSLKPWSVPCLLLLLCTAWTVALADNDLWVLVETGKLRLSVLQGDTVQRTYNNISIGRRGTTPDKLRGDDRTPLGEFRIVRITEDSPFHRFLGLDYPDPQRAQRAQQAGTINQGQLAAIRRARKARQEPPQNTALGGYIGIHGVGRGDLAVHEDFNWTHGCIALTNAQIDDLSVWVGIGTRVIIKP